MIGGSELRDNEQERVIGEGWYVNGTGTAIVKYEASLMNDFVSIYFIYPRNPINLRVLLVRLTLQDYQTVFLPLIDNTGRAGPAAESPKLTINGIEIAPGSWWSEALLRGDQEQQAGGKRSGKSHKRSGKSGKKRSGHKIRKLRKSCNKSRRRN